MPSAGFEPAIPASERPQTHVLDRAATGICLFSLGSPTKILYVFLISLYASYMHRPPIIIKVIALIIFSEQNKSLSSPLYSLSHPPVSPPYVQIFHPVPCSQAPPSFTPIPVAAVCICLVPDSTLLRDLLSSFSSVPPGTCHGSASN
jgi:hypothetical protein